MRNKIIQFVPDIKKFYFIDEAYRTKEYRAFMNEVTLFVQTGKNKHDDACDSLAVLVDFLDTRGRGGDGDEEVVLNGRIYQIVYCRAQVAGV